MNDINVFPMFPTFSQLFFFMLLNYDQNESARASERREKSLPTLTDRKVPWMFRNSLHTSRFHPMTGVLWSHKHDLLLRRQQQQTLQHQTVRLVAPSSISLSDAENTEQRRTFKSRVALSSHRRDFLNNPSTLPMETFWLFICFFLLFAVLMSQETSKTGSRP